jgi:hypothetical protein
VKIRRLVALSMLAVVTAAVAAPSPATGDGFSCPDGYQPVPAAFASDRDRNGNGIVCEKVPPSSNNHANSKDDKGLEFVDDI